MSRSAQPVRQRKPSKWHHITLRCPLDLDRALEIRCTALDITKATACQQALRRWLGKHAPPPSPDPPVPDRRVPTDEELDRRALELELGEPVA